MDRFALFPTPVFVYDVANTEELNRELAAKILDEANSTPGIRRSNRGGWHSAPDLTQRTDHCFVTMMKLIAEHVTGTMQQLAAAMRVSPVPQWRFSAQAWAMVMRQGDFTILHDHGTSHWSMSYYVDAGDSDPVTQPESGLLALVDPRRCIRAIPGLDDFNMTTFTVRPQTGRLVIFPGWIQHYVQPYFGTRPRIAVACNVSMDLIAGPGGAQNMG